MQPHSMIGAFDAKTRLSELLLRVAKGERFTITKHGVPVADLVPASLPGLGLVREATLADLKAFAKGKRLKGIKIRDLIDEGRR